MIRALVTLASLPALAVSLAVASADHPLKAKITAYQEQAACSAKVEPQAFSEAFLAARTEAQKQEVNRKSFCHATLDFSKDIDSALLKPVPARDSLRLLDSLTDALSSWDEGGIETYHSKEVLEDLLLKEVQPALDSMLDFHRLKKLTYKPFLINTQDMVSLECFRFPVAPSDTAQYAAEYGLAKAIQAYYDNHLDWVWSPENRATVIKDLDDKITRLENRHLYGYPATPWEAAWGDWGRFQAIFLHPTLLYVVDDQGLDLENVRPFAEYAGGVVYFGDNRWFAGLSVVGDFGERIGLLFHLRNWVSAGITCGETDWPSERAYFPPADCVNPRVSFTVGKVTQGISRALFNSRK